MALLLNDDRYTDSLADHLDALERFSFTQPDYHLCEIPIRYWDDYWFGKSALYGDTFPHYWSVLTSRAFARYSQASGRKEYLAKAEECVRGTLCLFGSDGSASCAYVYPFTVRGRRGQFYDKWANDQDFALYFASMIL